MSTVGQRCRTGGSLKPAELTAVAALVSVVLSLRMLRATCDQVLKDILQQTVVVQATPELDMPEGERKLNNQGEQG
ncbi:MAG: hypothetical protein U1E49_02820 [Hyphomicrobiaceae bacterium]